VNERRLRRTATWFLSACSVFAAGACGSSAGTNATPTTTIAAASTTTAAAPITTAATTAGGSSTTGATGSGTATFDGTYQGTIEIDQCVGSGSDSTASVKVTYAGSSGVFPGDVSARELGFQGPKSDDFDSHYLDTPLNSDGSGWALDGIKVVDSSGQESLTLHGTLRCP
jgi:hypothetical protein